MKTKAIVQDLCWNLRRKGHQFSDINYYENILLRELEILEILKKYTIIKAYTQPGKQPLFLLNGHKIDASLYNKIIEWKLED